MILTLVQQNESFDSKLFHGKHFKLLWVTNSWGFWYLCKSFPNFYIKWIQIYRKTGLQEGYLSIPNTMSKFQPKRFQKFYFVVIRNVKRKWKIRYSIHFLALQKETLNKQNSFTRCYSTYLRFLEGLLVTAMTTQGLRFHQYIIKQPVK